VGSAAPTPQWLAADTSPAAISRSASSRGIVSPVGIANSLSGLSGIPASEMWIGAPRTTEIAFRIVIAV
jgi:hypothetical protein